MKKRASSSINKKEVLVKEREDNWYVAPSGGIPEYSAEKDPHCPTGQIRKFNEEKRLKAQILAKRDKATSTFIKTTLDHSMEEIKLDMEGGLGKPGRDAKSKVKTKESFAEIEILQKIVVRENLLAELQRLLKSQNDVSACLAEVVELVKAMRFQTLDIVEDISAWQQTQARPQGFQYKGFNYLVKIKADLDFLDLYEEIVEKFCFEFRSNPLAYRGGGNVISGYGHDKTKKLYSQGLLRSYYSESDDDFLDGLEVSRLLSAEKVIQSEFNRIAKDKLAGQAVAQLQQQSDGNGGDVLDRDIFNSLSKSAPSLPDMGAYEDGGGAEGDNQPNTADGTGFKVGNKGKKPRKVVKTATAVNPKKIKQERIAALVEEASELKGMMVNVDEKVQFLTNHHLDLLNQRATMDARLKEARSMGKEVAAQHIAAEISVNSAAIIDNNAKIKDLQRECYFVNLERKRKLGTAQKLREEIEESKRRASLQKKIEAKIKKEGLLAALQSFNTKATVEEIATLGDKALGRRPTSASAAARQSSSPPRSGNRARRDAGGKQADLQGDGKDAARSLRGSESLPVLGQQGADWSLTSLSAEETSPGTAAAFPALLETEEEYDEEEDEEVPRSLLQRVAHTTRDVAAELEREAQSELPESPLVAEAELPAVEAQQGSLSSAQAPVIRLEDYDEDMGADEYDVREQHADDEDEEGEEGDEEQGEEGGEGEGGEDEGDEEDDGEAEGGEQGEEEEEQEAGVGGEYEGGEEEQGDQQRWEQPHGEYVHDEYQYQDGAHESGDYPDSGQYYGDGGNHEHETQYYYENQQQDSYGYEYQQGGDSGQVYYPPSGEAQYSYASEYASEQPDQMAGSSSERHHTGFQAGHLLSPDASLDGSHLSPLGYRYQSGAESEHDAWAAEPAAEHTIVMASASSTLPRKSSQNEMYISDDEDGHEAEHAPIGGEHSPLAYTTYTDSSPFAEFSESPDRAPVPSSSSRAKSGVSDMTVSPISISSPKGFQYASDGFISDDSPDPRTSEKYHSQHQQQGQGDVEERVETAPQRDPSQQLFLEADGAGMEDNAAAVGVVVGADGAIDYPAGGAYALVRSLKLSPRPNV